jgi:Leucine-rich repeat (LRR) protein
MYLSHLSPLMRVVTTTRGIETATLQRRVESASLPHHDSQERAAASQRLPTRAAATLLLLATLACLGPFLFLGTRDRYPFSDGNKCRPCACSGEALLESCAIPARLGVRYLHVEGRGIRGITPGTFRGFSTLQSLHLSQNNISTLPVGALDGLGRLRSLDISANRIGTLGANVFGAVPWLTTLVLRGTLLTALRPGAFAGLDQLRNLFLDGSDLLHVVEPSALADTPLLAYVWVGASALNCSRLEVSDGITCFDDASCDVEHIGWLGDGRCDSRGGYDTADCAWDGGDCA